MSLPVSEPAPEPARAAVAVVDMQDQGRASPEAAAALDDGGAPVFDESTEAVFLGEARERGEPVRPIAAKPNDPEPEEADAKPLPALATLVEKIPAEVRDALDDLFRAKFVRVQRVPRKALKDSP